MAFKITEMAKKAAYEKQQKARAERTSLLRERIAKKAEEEGPDSIWAEMLAEMDAAPTP